MKNGNPAGADSLRQAILDANTATGHDTIIIMDTANDFSHINVGNSALPRITDGLTIYTESGETAFIHCEDCVGAERWGLFVEITESNRSKSVSFTDLEVANAQGDAFRLGGSELESATLTACFVYGSSPTYNAGAGFLVESCSATNITLTDCDVWRRQTGISLATSAHVDTLTIEGAQVQAPDCTPPVANWFGIKCEGTGNVIIQDHVEDNTVIRDSCIFDIPGTGIYLNGNGSTALQAQITGTEIGITPSDAPGPITGNGIEVVDWSGTIDLDDSHTSYLLQNTIANCGGSGVQITNSLSVSLALNTIHDNDGNGVAIASDGTGESSDVLLFDNAIHDNDGNGVAIISNDSGESSDIRLLDNTIQDNGGDGILLSAASYGSLGNIVVGDDTFSSYNTIENNVGHGISFIASGAGAISGVDIIYNAIANNALGSIAVDDDNCLYDVSNAFFYGNYFVDSSPPIDLGEDSNHGLDAPVINADEVRLDGDDWIIPFSLDAGTTFGDKDFVFQLYAFDPASSQYEQVTYATGTLASDGSFSAAFTLSTASYSEGDYLTILASCIEDCAQAGDTSEFSNTAMIQDTPPRIEGVRVANAAGTSSDTFAPAADSDAQLQTVRVYGGVRTVSITFSRGDVVTNKYALAIVRGDEQVTIYADNTDVTWSGDGYTATWTLDSSVPFGEWRVVLDDANVLTPNDTLLDGEWTNPGYFGDNLDNSKFPSGDDAAGGDFQFTFTSLPADANRDGKVDDVDASIMGAHWRQMTGAHWEDGDCTGDGAVSDPDAAILAVYWGQMLWQPPERSAMFGGSPQTVAALDAVFARYDLTTPEISDNITPGDARWDSPFDDLFDALEFGVAA